MKRLLLACDGTWSRADQQDPTNVVRLTERVPARGADGVEQVVRYHPGVGTMPGERILGGLFGYGLSADVREVYEFVVEHFEPGDELYFVGFSRGAFTARSCVGLIRNAGVLRRENLDRVDEAIELYRDRSPSTHPTGAEATAFRAAWSQETRIRFIGVWDTVGALGIPRLGLDWPVLRWLGRLNQRWAFHDTALSSWVDHGAQALAVDERRLPFAPTVWSPHGPGAGRRIEQAWLAGSHSDVGGGQPERGLADLGLWWLAGQAVEAGLALDPPPGPREPAWTSGVLHDSRTGIFRLLPARTRSIGAVDPETEALAGTVLDRRDDPTLHYAPVNVAAYLDRGGVVTRL